MLDRLELSTKQFFFSFGLLLSLSLSVSAFSFTDSSPPLLFTK